MACFVVPMTEALITTIAAHVIERHTKVKKESSPALIETHTPFYKKLKILSNMLWGGSALLAFEHLWHGEIEPWFPFLTAANDPAAAQIMIQEMATVGTTMATLTTLIWGVSVIISSVKTRKMQPQEVSIK